MLTLFRQVSLRHLLEERFKTVVAVLGVALGIAVFLSIRLANGSVLGAFRSTVDVIAGKAQLQATEPPRGLSDAAYLTVKRTPGVAAVAPIIEVTTVAPAWNREAITVLGVDLFSEAPFRTYAMEGASDQSTAMSFLGDAHAIAITDRMAAAHRLRVGSAIKLRYADRSMVWHVAEIIHSDDFTRAYAGRVAVVDIAAAQEAFGKIRRLDRLDIISSPGTDIPDLQTRLTAALGPGSRVERPRSRSGQVESLLGAFQLNLTALSAIAIFVGMFLIYNAMSIAVVRRRKEIGILRQLGVTQRQILVLFLAEGSFYGIVGSLLGLALGIALANAALHSVAATVTALYVRVEAERIILSPALIGESLLIGFLTAVLASLAPAREAAATPPGQSAREGSIAAKTGTVAGRFTLMGALVLLASALLSAGAVRFHQPYLGFTAAFGVLGGFSLLAPMATAAFSRIVRRPADRLFGAEGLLAAGYLANSLDRTAVVVAALMVSLAMFIGVSVMVASFRQTVVSWIGQTIIADLFVQSTTWDVSGEDATIPSKVLAELHTVAGVAALDEYRATFGTYRGQRVEITAATFDALAPYGHLLFRGGDTSEIVERAKARDEIIVTEGLTLKLGKAEGDVMTLETPTGPHTFRIAGVYYDYTTNGPALVMDLALYRRLWHDPDVNSVAVYLKNPADAEHMRSEIERRFGEGGGIVVTTNREIHDQAIRIFDQTFRVTYALEFISIAVAILGIINTMTALILQRGRELGILRSVGATRRQLKKIILIESGLIGVISYIVGAACGTVLAWLLIYVINKQFFGWTVQIRWTPTVFAEGAVITVVTSLLAGYLPARQAANRGVTEAVRAE